MLAGLHLACALCLAPMTHPSDFWRVQASPESQQTPIKGQDPLDAMRGQGPTGWVQAPEPRGLNAPVRDAQGNGAGGAGAGKDGGQVPPGQNPGAPVANSLPNPSGIAPDSPRKP